MHETAGEQPVHAAADGPCPFAPPAGLWQEPLASAILLPTGIRDIGLGVMPGLLQTPEYARAVLQAIVAHRAPDVVEQLIEGRIARQQRVLSADSPPQFQAILEASVLHRLVGSTARLLKKLTRQHWPKRGRRSCPLNCEA